MLARARILVAVGLSMLPACATSALRSGVPGSEEEGYATYYSPRLAGRLTANGERYDRAAFTAAHPVLPFGSWVQVDRVDVPRSVVVRINDRCAGRRKIIDLSEAAAREMDMLRRGRVPVRLRVLPPQTAAPSLGAPQ